METAACARALAAFVDKSAPLQLLPGGAAHVTRAALTAKVIASRGPIPWPNAIQRQLDPSDPAFLPALELHPVLAARDRTIVGLPGRNPTAWVDPAGWVGIVFKNTPWKYLRGR